MTTKNQFVIVDCQTSGSSPVNAAVIDLAWTLVDQQGQLLVPIRSYLIQPEHLDQWPQKRILAMTGITEAELALADLPLQVFELFSEELRAWQPLRVVAQDTYSETFLAWTQRRFLAWALWRLRAEAASPEVIEQEDEELDDPADKIALDPTDPVI